MNKKLLIFLSCLAAILLLCLFGCANTNEPLTETRFFIGTVCSISLYDKKDKALLDKAFERIESLEKLLSANEAGTEIDLINQNAGIKETYVSAETFGLIQKGLEYSDLSEGSFDITIGTLTSLWKIGTSKASIPGEDELIAARELVNYTEVELNEADKTIFLKETGMKLDLGAIAKGFIADEAAKVLLENGVKSAIIDLGGNIIFLGSKNGNEWSCGVRDPFSSMDESVGIISCEDKSLVTSGIYERYFEQGEMRYHHILSPSTGYPVNNELASVTIICKTSADADALSTVTFTKGLREGLKIIEELDSIEAVFITKDYEIYLTSGLKDTFKLTNKNFKIME